ncbi:hypothetical protein POVWA1_028290 [Plasmodium ovale wallikeri]|uniref:Uncharacterized protein n=1 Tax=Plasmodium ovale wallikeri TaxID=864142 RepID=A0A1A8YVA0_PLAOA|nr:hypothetical protein POVWA1_028290 [Plasmodium ovale wallikeri]
MPNSTMEHLIWTNKECAFFHFNNIACLQCTTVITQNCIPYTTLNTGRFNRNTCKCEKYHMCKTDVGEWLYVNS